MLQDCHKHLTMSAKILPILRNHIHFSCSLPVLLCLCHCQKHRGKCHCQKHRGKCHCQKQSAKQTNLLENVSKHNQKNAIPETIGSSEKY